MSAAAAGSPDHQQLVVRRAIALGLLVLVLVLLVVGVNACRNSAKENALRDYSSSASNLLNASNTQVARPFFALLNGARGRSPVNVETQVNQLRGLAEEQADRARDESVRDEVVGAQRNLVLALDLRAGALARVAEQIRSALGSQEADRAVGRIAGQMQALLASDVLVSQRVAPLVSEALADEDVVAPAVTTRRFLGDFGWLAPPTVSQRLGGAGGTGADGSGALRPGTHGHGLLATAIGTTTLQPGGAANQVAASSNPQFTVRFQNQGENEEFDVPVSVRISGAGRPVTARRTVDETQAGAESTVTIPLGQAPPVGTPVTVAVSVGTVPGEETTDNNRSSYTVLFTR